MAKRSGEHFRLGATMGEEKGNEDKETRVPRTKAARPLSAGLTDGKAGPGLRKDPPDLGTWKVGDLAYLKPEVELEEGLPEDERVIWKTSLLQLKRRDPGNGAHWFRGKPHWVVFDTSGELDERWVAEDSLMHPPQPDGTRTPTGEKKQKMARKAEGAAHS